MKKLKTYIGICDFMTESQVLEMLSIFRRYSYAGLQLMVGTMTSFKVLNGIPSKWTGVFPTKEDLKNIFSINDNLLINCLHYADYEDNPGLSTTLINVVDHCGEYLDAIQLDMVWPDPKELALFKKIHNNTEIVLQVSKKSMSECHDNPISVAKKIHNEYNGLISYVLLDCSMGKGVPINTSLIEGYIEAITTHSGELKIAVAGGLGPDTVGSVEKLINDWRVSIDAQSKLRLSGKATDPIDWDLAKKYLHEAIGFYL